MKYTIQLLRSVKRETLLVKCLSTDHLKYTACLLEFKKTQFLEEAFSAKYLGWPTFIVMLISKIWRRIISKIGKNLQQQQQQNHM